MLSIILVGTRTTIACMIEPKKNVGGANWASSAVSSKPSEALSFALSASGNGARSDDIADLDDNAYNGLKTDVRVFAKDDR